MTDCSICRSSCPPGPAWGRPAHSAGGHSDGSWTELMEAGWRWPRLPQPLVLRSPQPQGPPPPPPAPHSVSGHSLEKKHSRASWWSSSAHFFPLSGRDLGRDGPILIESQPHRIQSCKQLNIKQCIIHCSTVPWQLLLNNKIFMSHDSSTCFIAI